MEPVSTDLNNEGVVLIRSDKTWYGVCHEGPSENWGKDEAMVACVQLEFKGGWPVTMQNVNASNLAGAFANDIDCNWRKYF